MGNIIKINGAELLKQLKATGQSIEKISVYVLNRGKGFIYDACRNNKIEEDLLDALRGMYDISKENIVAVSEQKEKQQENKNDENLIIYANGIEKLLREILAEQKNTNIKLNELILRVNNLNSFNKQIHESVEKIERNSKFMIGKRD